MRTLKSLSFGLLACVALANPLSAKEYKKVDLLPNQMVLPTAWTQSSAEYKALTTQIYNMSKIVLDMHLIRPTEKPYAVILDLDETVLDNSPYQAMTVAQETGYPHGWFDWVDAAEAKAVPGSLDFLHYADSKGVKIFYLSNRKIKGDRLIPGMQNSLENLENLGAPQAVRSQMYLRDGSSSKESRRQAIAKDHNVIMVFGDNLNDHSDDFRGKSVAERKDAVDKHSAKFGTTFIVLPNTMYGEWEGAMYEGKWGAPVSEKVQMRKDALEYWRP